MRNFIWLLDRWEGSKYLKNIFKAICIKNAECLLNILPFQIVAAF